MIMVPNAIISTAISSIRPSYKLHSPGLSIYGKTDITLDRELKCPVPGITSITTGYMLTGLANTHIENPPVSDM